MEDREEKKNFIWGYLSLWLDAFPDRPITEGSSKKYWCEETGVGANFATKVNVDGYKGTISKVDELVEHFEKASDGENAELNKDETEAIQRGVRELPIEGKDYWRFGPYKITGIPASKKIKKLVVTEKNGKEEIKDYKIIFYENKQPKVGTYKDIKNNKRFYLCIPKASSGEFNFEFITETESSKQTMWADLYFLESTVYNWQNLVIAEDGKEDGPGKPISTSINVKTPGSGKFKIIKKDKYNNARLSGAKFLIFYFEGNENGAHLHNGTNNKFWTFDYIPSTDVRRTEGTPEYEEYHKKNDKGELIYGWADRYYVSKNGEAKKISKEEAMKNEKDYIFTTDVAGEICLDGLQFPENRYYCAIECETPADYKWDPAFDTYWNGGDNYFVLNPNENNPGVYVTEVPNITTKWCNLNLEKVNLMDHNIKLENVGFRFYNDEYGWLSGHENEGNGYSYSWDETKAEEYKTNDVGRIELNNIVSEGNWYCYENPKTLPYGYEMLGDGAYEIGKIENNSTKLYIVENEQKRVKLSGFVWLDQENSKGGDGNTRNNLFRYGDSDNTDLLFDGIEVRLKNKITGETVKTAITGKSESELYKKGHGEYQFTDVEIKELEDLCIEFEYDGLTYQNVICPDMNKINQYINSEGESNPNYDVTTANIASKATEGKREQFNKTFSVIEGKGSDNSTRGIRKGEKGTIFEDLEYEKKENHTMALKNGEYALHENEGYIATSNKGKYPIQADTTTSGYNIRNNFTWGRKEIGNINLGLYKREQPDIALRKDLHNVKLEINGKGHTYTYAKRYNDSDREDGEWNIGVKFGENYGNRPYSRAVYKSDYNYTIKDSTKKSNELQVYVTYQLTMQNQSSSLKTKVNSIVDYFDGNYTIETAGTKVEADGSPNGNLKDQCKEDSDYKGNKYKKLIITNATEIEDDTEIEDGKIKAGKEQSIYVQFKLDREKVEKILTGKNEEDIAETLLNNIAEINSYSVYDDNGIYAGIDRDSNPGNSIPGQINTYEDDTESAPALQLEVANAREMKGTVFIDKPDLMNRELYGKNNSLNPEGVMSGYVRQGNGRYDEGEEATVEGVTVELRDAETRETVKVYDEKNPKEWKKATVDTKDNGEFVITNYIPGDYVVTYTWGGQTYQVENKSKTITVQDYKGTIYPEKERQNHTGTQRTNNSQDNEADKNRWWHVSINSQTGKKNNNETRYTDAIDDYETRKKIDEPIKEVTKNTKEEVDTAYKANQQSGEIITQMKSTTPKMEIGVEFSSYTDPSSGDSYKYCIHDIDFGIIERAKQDLVLTKRIKTMKVTLANGQVVADLTINEEGKVEGEKKGITYMQPQPNIEPKNGFIRLELDNELIQGTKLEVTYEIKATNNSELDYIPDSGIDNDTATFYTYGKISNNVPITISPTEIVDYLDKNWSFDSKQYEQTWQVKEVTNINVIQDVVNSESIAEKMILYTDTMKSTELVPNNVENNKQNLKQSEAVELKVSKLLTTTDEISLENEAEEVKVNKTGGRTLETVPGNYIPGTGATEADDSMAETTIVTPATGLNLNYILPIAIGVTALIILGVGVIIIKKKAI